MGNCPFESRYNGLYRGTGLGRLAWAQLGHGHDTARPCPRHGVVGPRYRPRYSRPACGVCDSARAHGLARGSHDTNLYRGWGRPFGLRYSAARAAIWYPTPYDTAQERGETHGRRATRPRSLRYDAQQRALQHGAWGTELDTVKRELRHGRGQACDTAQCTRSVRAGWARMCTWCTPLNFDSMHCSESLFGTLFMKTVHEHCSRFFSKK